MRSDGEYILETRGLTKEFKGFLAVNRVDLRVRRGAIHALIGPNGAGKTTVFNLLTKFLQPTSGIGLRFAEVLAAGGAKVVLAARRIDRLAEVARAI